MNRRMMSWAGAGAVTLLGAAGGAWILSLPLPRKADLQAIPEDESNAIVNGLKPPKRQRPVIAIVGINDATEVTDYVMPYGILRRAGVADVMLVATDPGPVKLFPALRVEPDTTVAQ